MSLKPCNLLRHSLFPAQSEFMTSMRWKALKELYIFYILEEIANTYLIVYLRISFNNLLIGALCSPALSDRYKCPNHKHCYHKSYEPEKEKDQYGDLW